MENEEKLEEVNTRDNLIGMKPQELASHINYVLGKQYQPHQLHSWEDIGLVGYVDRDSNDTRVYDEGLIERVTKIAALKSIGVSSEDIVEFLDRPSERVKGIVKVAALAYSEKLLPYVNGMLT